jgi:hypothetical protein
MTLTFGDASCILKIRLSPTALSLLKMEPALGFERIPG